MSATATSSATPAAVMLRETQSLRTLAGKAGDSDLEPMLQAAAAAWPGERPPVENLRFEPGKLTLGASGWSDAQIEQFRSVLQPAGFRVDASEGRLVAHPRPPARSAAPHGTDPPPADPALTDARQQAGRSGRRGRRASAS